jgi:hypothetical protein
MLVSRIKPPIQKLFKLNFNKQRYHLQKGIPPLPPTESERAEWFRKRELREEKQSSDPRPHLIEKKHTCKKELKLSATGKLKSIIYDLPTIYYNHKNGMTCIPACITMMPFTNDSSENINNYKQHVFNFLRTTPNSENDHFNQMMVTRNALKIMTLDKNPDTALQIIDALSTYGPLLISPMRNMAHHAIIMGVDMTNKETPLLVKNPIEHNESIYRFPKGSLSTDDSLSFFSLQNAYTFKSMSWYQTYKEENFYAREEFEKPVPFIGAAYDFLRLNS